MKYYKTKLEIKHKSVNNPVTKADLAANEIIKKILISKYPNFGWLSEETKDSEHRLNNEYVWIIDPIDGTKEFIEGISNFAISIGLVKNHKPILGVWPKNFRNECKKPKYKANKYFPIEMYKGKKK